MLSRNTDRCGKGRHVGINHLEPENTQVISLSDVLSSKKINLVEQGVSGHNTSNPLIPDHGANIVRHVCLSVVGSLAYMPVRHWPLLAEIEELSTLYFHGQIGN